MNIFMMYVGVLLVLAGAWLLFMEILKMGWG